MHSDTRLQTTGESHYPVAPALIRDEQGLNVLSPKTHEVTFTNSIREIIALSGMPTARLSKVVYARTPESEKHSGWRTLGSMCVGGPEFGTLTITDAVTDKNILLGMGTTIYHELAHLANPYDFANTVNRRVYKSPAMAEEVKGYIDQLAEQTAQTKIYLNNYHKKIYQDAAEMRAKGNFEGAERLIKLETHAIVMEELARDPKGLMQKSMSQVAAMKEMGLNGVDAYKVGLQCFAALVGFGDSREQIEGKLSTDRAQIRSILASAGETMEDSSVIKAVSALDSGMLGLGDSELYFDPIRRIWLRKPRYSN